MPKKWNVLPKAPAEIFEQFPETNAIITQLLFNRGIIDQQSVDDFLNPDYSDHSHDPFLFRDMEKAVTRIFSAIENKEKILVYGDYDADGVTSSAVMVEALRLLGGDVDIYIPFRETEGYGLNAKAAEGFIEQKINLVVTVDCGVSNFDEVEILVNAGIDVVITDHHQAPPILPNALAIVNPNVDGEPYPFKQLAGVGVAFKVAQALAQRASEHKVNQLNPGWEKWLMDLVAIGTIADMVSLLDESRVFVKYGLLVLKKTRRPGLLALLNSSNGNKIRIDEQVVGWQISPRLNAAGRMNHASVAYQLLITNEDNEAQKLTQELNEANKNRQQLTEKVKNEALTAIGETENKNILIAVGQDWPTGVVGLVAGKIMDNLSRPTLVISNFNGEVIGSGRSLAGFNITNALHLCAHHLKRFGGHAQACGFTLNSPESIEPFINEITAIAEKELLDKELIPQIDIEAEIALEDVDWSLFESLQHFAPYGEKNPKPRFLARDLSVVEHKALGSDLKHIRLMVKHNTEVVRKTIGFSMGEWCATLKVGNKIDMIFEVDVNEWNGNRELQLKIVDLKFSQND